MKMMKQSLNPPDFYCFVLYFILLTLAEYGLIQFISSRTHCKRMEIFYYSVQSVASC